MIGDVSNCVSHSVLSQLKRSNMNKDPVIWTIWCIKCDAQRGGSPQKHIIEYHGSKNFQGKTLACFDATCTRCKAQDEKTISTRHEIPIASYNALISRPDIYAGNTAPWYSVLLTGRYLWQPIVSSKSKLLTQKTTAVKYGVFLNTLCTDKLVGQNKREYTCGRSRDHNIFFSSLWRGYLHGVAFLLLPTITLCAMIRI